MKLMWFHLMPYTELPDDFREKHPSVWVDIHSSLFDPRRAHLMYNDFMDELEFAAECGFDAVCVNEHHSNGYGLMPSPNLIASALSRRTTDTALCVMGNSLANRLIAEKSLPSIKQLPSLTTVTRLRRA